MTMWEPNYVIIVCAGIAVTWIVFTWMLEALGD